MDTKFLSVYYTVTLEKDGEFETGYKTIIAYIIQENKPHNILCETIHVEDKTIDFLMDYFGEFHKFVSFTEL